MSSVLTHISQPRTACFVITQGPDQTGVYYFLKSAVENWAATHENVSSVGSLHTVVSGNFADTVRDLDYEDTLDGRKTLIDLGRQIIIGNVVNSRLLVLRQVQFFGDAVDGGDGSEGYVVVENNTYDLAQNDWGRFTVRVARI